MVKGKINSQAKLTASGNLGNMWFRGKVFVKGNTEVFNSGLAVDSKRMGRSYYVRL